MISINNNIIITLHKKQDITYILKTIKKNNKQIFKTLQGHYINSYTWDDSFYTDDIIIVNHCNSQ